MAKKRGRVIVVGSSNTDLVVHCGRLPRAGETVIGGDLKTFAGGKGANQAVAAARAGAEVRFIGAFGDDAFGKARRADLEKEGVDCSGGVVKKGVPSGVALIGIGASGASGAKGRKNARAENLILVAPGANGKLTAADVRRGLPGRLTHRDVLLCSMEVPIPALQAAMRMATRKGTLIILNPAPLPAQGLPKALLAHCHYLTPNESEFEGISGAKVGTAAAKRKAAAVPGHMEHGVPYPDFLVTRGAAGVDAYLRGAYTAAYAKPPKVKALDTVGAGDCFNGCLAAQLALDGNDLNLAVRFAVAASAISVTRHGAQASMPRRGEIRKLLKRMK